MCQSVIVRVDGNAPIGMGHVTRCTVLVERLRRHGFGPFRYIIKDFPPAVEFFKNESVEVSALASDIGLEEEANAVRQAAEDMGSSVIVFDLLELHDEFIEIACPESVLPVALFDLPTPPLLKRPLVFNHNVVWKESKQATVRMENYFGGPEYVIINPIFAEIRKHYRFVPDVKRLFLNQGGGDPYNLTTKILQALLPLKDQITVDVVLGGAFAFHKELATALEKWEGRYHLHESISHSEVACLMSKAGCAHTASGNMLYELMTIGVPSIAVSHHRNHSIVADFFAKRGAVAHLGIGTEIDQETILTRTMSLIEGSERRESFFSKGRELVDGKGAERTAKKIVESL